MSTFKFGFSSGDCTDLASSVLEGSDCKNELAWLPAKEIFLSECRRTTTDPTLNKQTVKINDVSVQYISNLELEDSVVPFSVSEKHDHSDLIPAIYEGGLKVWECTFDLANYVMSVDEPVNFKLKTVLDLGCGTGILGLLALKLGAEVVHFQDYNEDVLRQVTIPNLLLNFSTERSSCSFFSGDWLSFSNLNDVCYDVILTCETIYNDKNYQKLHDTLKKKLKTDGVILLAAKTYYFGVGGGTRQFESVVEKENIFDATVCWTCTTGVRREILKIKFK